MNPDQVEEALARLTPEQRRALEEKLHARRAPVDSSIPRRPDPSVHPLSPGQERLWTLSRLRPGDPIYNIDAAWHLFGPLDRSALEVALHTVVERHEPLRATVATRDGDPVQDVHPASDFTVGHLDLSAGEIGDEVLSKEVERLAIQPFDLAVDLPFRATLIRLGPHDHILVIVAHHIACDGWSVKVLASELGPSYAAALAGNPPDLPELDITYADVAYWQRTAGTRAADLDYWSGELKGKVEALRLPRTRSNRHHGRADGASHSFAIPAGLLAGVTSVARTHRVTPFAVLLAAYQATLNRITGQEQIVLCTPVAGRSHVEMESLIGYFNNLVPLAGSLSGDPTLLELVQSAATTISDAFDHSTPSFQEIASLDGVADVALSRALFVLQDGETPSPDLPGLRAVSIRHDAESSDLDLAVFLRPDGEGLRGVSVFRSGIFETEAVASVLDDFVSVLEQLVADPDMPISQLPDLGDSPTEDALAQDTSRTSKNPTSLVEARLQGLWERVFKRDVHIDDDFFDLGGHSLLAAELIAAIEEEFQLDPLPLSMLFEAPTVTRFSRLLESTDPARGWQSVVPIKPDGDRPPLFFVHAHGGNVIGYSDLGRRLSTRQPLYGVQSPRGDLGVRRIEDMASAYIEEIKTVQPSGPYLVGGWCLGGDVAFEIGRLLREAGEEVALVLMVDNPRPEYIQASAEGGIRDKVDRVATRLDMEWTNLLEAPRRGAYMVDRTQRLMRRATVAMERLATKRGDDLPFGLSHSQAFRQEQVAAEHDKAYEAYVPEPYGGRVAVFRAELQPRGRTEDPTLGWAPYVTGEVVDYELPGHRLGMLSEPRIQHSAQIIEDAIVRALEPEGQR